MHAKLKLFPVLNQSFKMNKEMTDKHDIICLCYLGYLSQSLSVNNNNFKKPQENIQCN